MSQEDKKLQEEDIELEEQKEQEENQDKSQDETDKKEENSLEDELNKCKEQLKEKENEYLRVFADFENSKKRLEKEKSSALMYANESFAKDLLTVLDTFENALKSIDQIDANDEGAIDKIKEGMSLTYEQLLSILKKNGVEEIECGTEFDPNYHQAVMQVDSDKHESGQIVDVLQKGYKLKDRLLRAAMVSSCK